MGRSQETFNKKEVRNKNQKKRKEKEQKRLARKNSDKSGNQEDMIAYVDEFGMISSVPPDPDKKLEIKTEDIRISTPRKDSESDADNQRKGTVTFYDDAKGYGFIKDSDTGESIFVHAKILQETVNAGDKVFYEAERSPKGYSAIWVKHIDEKGA
ncbi:MAG TPA: cold shock domain-containing protein [Bacteroidales bacterium]|nr:cold shock domain-containing protein [Bacteroidales bacterium]HPT01059.1 cold shock domain-containing protein [Bacteroidales bacterium]